MIPYDAPCITTLLRSMSSDRLASVHPYDFQRQPADTVLPRKRLDILIDNEKQRRNA